MKLLRHWTNFYKNPNTFSELAKCFVKRRSSYYGIFVAKILIRIYQVTLGPFIGGSCRFYPSCSHYALEAYDLHSFFEATRLILKRISSCHPLGSSGYDPVPNKRKINEA